MTSEEFPGLTDIHAHPAMNAFLWGRDLRRHYWTGHHFNPLASLTDFKMLEKGGVKVLWSSLHIPERQYFDCWYIKLAAHLFSGGRKLLKRNAWECLLLMATKMEEQVGRSGDRFEMAGSNKELDDVLKAGKTAIVHTVEDGRVLGAGFDDPTEDDWLARVDELARRGIASITLAHLFPNELAGHTEGIPEKQRKSRLCPLHTKVDLTRGLEDLGETVVRRMVDQRVIPDVTHCTPLARAKVYDIVKEESPDTKFPVIASHNGVQTMNDVPYNLDKDDVKAIADSGGVVGVIFMPYWLDKANPGPGRDAIWRTMETLRDWNDGSWKHVAIGTDFDGFTDPPDDWKNASKLPGVREMLEEKGVSREDQDAILGGNARRVLRAGWR